MQKYFQQLILMLFIVVTALNSYCQHMEYLGKYSYYIYGWTKESRINNGIKQYRQVLGTCFFIRNKKTTYISGAAHIFTGLSHSGEETDSYYPDTLYIRLYNDGEKKFKDFPFGIAKIKKSSDTNFFKTHADIFIYPIQIPGNYTINSIEKFIKHKAEYKEVTEAIMYGYPDSTPGLLQKCVMDPKSDTLVRFEENPGELDLQYKIKSGDFGAGNSGSPLFFKTKNSEIIFGGICIGGYPEGFSVFVPHSFVIKLLGN